VEVLWVEDIQRTPPGGHASTPNLDRIRKPSDAGGIEWQCLEDRRACERIASGLKVLATGQVDASRDYCPIVPYYSMPLKRQTHVVDNLNQRESFGFLA
jgi:hypothetical protein